MFTGIVEEQGVISNIATGKNSATLFIKCKKVLEGTKVGDSIAVNGVCLTVTTMGKGEYTADIMHETLNRSSLGQLKKGDYVNLERAMAADGRFGGHIVSGHIDGTGSISDIYEDDNAVWYTIKASKDILRYIVEKGSITIDGISLTVAYVDEQSFKVSTIPHTRKETNLSEKKAGSTVNLECDIIGKYVEKLMGFSDNGYLEGKKSNITEKLLAENGFI
ncbi:MAG: riboflavin synthase [Lachnospiraceae bacterium]|nr:riboflavin synthase [Lachnospiraceae bacterium]